MTEKLLNSVVFAETAHKMWEDIRRIFVPCVDLKIYQLRQIIATTRQDGDSVDVYHRTLSQAWMELSEYDPVAKCDCGGCKCETAKRAWEAREKERRYAFLMGLNNGLSYLRTQIMLMDPPPSSFGAYAMVRRAESRMKSSTR
ncbi:unnamed protein product [Thlaspi arvense]|uniref:Retrotransposon gag domain-containing protein n=1 Tax=Thlaspi arvense TaxID=13288 RepID=A0AAU9RDE2_THLAR|nr:unnamed protein product [Thlaspi arvense]